jgi:hypothetical protein
LKVPVFYLSLWDNLSKNETPEVTKEAVLKKLGAFPLPAPKILVDDQDVSDIIRVVVLQHKQCTSYYDTLYPMFNQPGSWHDVAEKLYDFCVDQIDYKIESLEMQWASSPMTIMRRGHCDCKGYALFCAGIIDAMKRAGEQVEWCFRFASYKIFNSIPGHVFVVINPKTDNIWLDPVLNTFNSRWPRPIWKVDRYVDTCRNMGVAAVGFIPGAGIPKGTTLNTSRAIGSAAENSLMQDFAEYAAGITNGIQVAQGSQVLNSICMAVLATASIAIPVIAAAIAIIKVAAVVVSDEFGPGSEAALLLNDWATNPLTAPVTMVETLLNGRTYNSDQYRAAQFYQFYVLGNTKANALNKISDAMVPPAMAWFMDRTGVFISGAEHILGLASSAADYMQYYGVNADTTMDVNRVNAAANVAQQFFVLNNVPGSWANCQGVYDAWVANLAIQQNETEEAAAAGANYTGVYSGEATTGPAPVDNSPVAPTTFPVLPVMAVGLAAGLLLIPSNK